MTNKTPVAERGQADGRVNWVHLDCKGALPDVPHLLEWLDYLAASGFNGVVFEYEDRLPWSSWPGTFRPGLDVQQWREVWAHSQSLGFEVVPLVQTLGHLEWLLKHDAYAGMSEAGHMSELCPMHSEVLPRVKAWLDEVIELHPDSSIIHLGADETWYLGSCPKCKAAAEDSPHGRFDGYIRHVGALCAHVISRGRTPMIWADMFWREQAADAAAELPEGVLCVDWQYTGGGPFDSVEKLKGVDRTVYGASGIRSGYDALLAMAPLRFRVDNVLGWNKLADAGEVAGVIHTVWGRAASLRPIYGPWEAWLPAFIAAGDPKRWEAHPMRPIVDELDAAMLSPTWQDLSSIRAKLDGLPTADVFEKRAVEWWKGALDHKVLRQETADIVLGEAGYRAVNESVGVDRDQVRMRLEAADRVLAGLDEWDRQAAKQWETMGLTPDFEEFRGTKTDGLRYLLGTLPRHRAAHESTGGLVAQPPRAPVS